MDFCAYRPGNFSLTSRLVPDGGITGASCVVSDLTTNYWDDTQPDPPEYDIYYCIVRARNACGSSGYGVASDGSQRVPGNPCP